MEKDLTNFDNKIPKEVSRGRVSKRIISVKIEDEIIILKRFKGGERKRQKYMNEKSIYLLLKKEDFLPKLKYFDDKNVILGFTDVGESLDIFKKKQPDEYNKQVENINQQIKDIVDRLLNKYGLYHNDLRDRNICIDSFFKVRLIDFDIASNKLLNRERKYYQEIGGNGMYYICQKI